MYSGNHKAPRFRVARLQDTFPTSGMVAAITNNPFDRCLVVKNIYNFSNNK